MESFVKYDGLYLSLSSPRITCRLSRWKLVQRGHRPGGKGNDKEWKEATRESREDLFLYTVYTNKLRGRENGTNTTCRSRRWRGTKQCCIVVLDGLLTQVSECLICTRDTCASLLSGSSTSRSMPLPFRRPQICGRLRVSIAWLGKRRE